MCGGTYAQYQHSAGFDGLSLRVRGNHLLLLLTAFVVRSIPACAGEPNGQKPRQYAGEVYPRVCGGTRFIVLTQEHLKGLSPRVRGNHGLTGIFRTHQGSIPACAGEPWTSLTTPTAIRVYPRVCGGTAGALAVGRRQAGLSPRVRGNPSRRDASSHHPGSIPACAGEPTAARLPTAMRAVYPRVCGGTHEMVGFGGLAAGLSPRVRGNRRPGNWSAIIARSIPACAGEPASRRFSPAGQPVYPRVCGGTPSGGRNLYANAGLSPRVRGNPLAPPPRTSTPRSIPACAGEPAGR